MSSFTTPVAGEKLAAARPAPSAGPAGATTDVGMLLPSFAKQRPGGLFIARAEIGNVERFFKFVDQVFSAPAYFAGLEYANFLLLLYSEEPPARNEAPLRLATQVRVFAVERRGLYKTLKMRKDGTLAEYLFEPLFIEIKEEVAVKGGPLLDDGAQPAATNIVSRFEPTKIDFDEFVAHLWVNGVRFGIDEKTVRSAIAQSERNRLVVARWSPPKPGKDAGFEEKTKSLHRDNSPKQLANGRLDLRQYTNRFPQVNSAETLLRKVPRVLGDPGRKITGEIVEPPVPKDFDLAELAGSGTRIEDRRDGQYIVAARTGFVSIDTASNQLSILENMVGREGVSLRATGNLTLSGDFYEEYGEVREQCRVEGLNMTFHADVFGNLVSNGGRILIEKILASGSASSPGGEIVIKGSAFSAVLNAPGGRIRVPYAESCTITASHVVIERAVFCRIVGENVELGATQGCTIATQSLAIAAPGAHRDRETMVFMLIPNLAANEQRQAELRKQLGESQARIDTLAAEITTLKSQKDLAGFLALQTRIANGEVRVEPAQEAGLQKLVSRFAPTMQKIEERESTIAELRSARALLEEQLAALLKAHARAEAGITCKLAKVAGETIVQGMRYDPALGFLEGEGLATMFTRMNGLDRKLERLFGGTSGSFHWQYKPEPAPA